MLTGGLAAAVLSVAPGAWIAFATRRSRMSFAARMGLAAALAPCVVAVEFYVLRWGGLTFEQTAAWLAWINAPALVLAWRGLRGGARRAAPRDGRHPGRVLIRAAFFAATAACVAIPWLADTEFRRFSWHGLMHTDICHAFARGAPRPEEPLLAGVPLAYPWFAHVHWALLAWAAGRSPTTMYLFTNLVCLAAAGALLYELARRLGASEPAALAAPLLAALGTNVVGLVGWSVTAPNDDGRVWAVLGDLRYAPFISKLVTFEPMAFGLVLFAALLLLATVALQRRATFELILAAAIPAAIGAVYPNLLPPALGVTGALALLLSGRRARARLGYARRDLWLAAGTAAAAMGAAIAIGLLYTSSRTTPPFVLSPVPGTVKKLCAATVALAPFAIPCVWAWRSRRAARRDPLAMLGLGAAGALLLNVGLRLGGQNEYKFFMCAGLCVVAPACVGLQRVLDRRGRWALAGSLPVMLALVMAAYTARRVPRMAAVVPRVQERSFWLALAPGEPDAEWTEAVRSRTPPDTMVVVSGSAIHVSAFAGRALLAPPLPDVYRAGFNEPARFDLLELRGYSPAEFDRRVSLVRRIYAGGTEPQMQTVLDELMRFGRPVALFFRPEDERTFGEWIESSGRASKLIDLEAGTLYLIPA